MSSVLDGSIPSLVVTSNMISSTASTISVQETSNNTQPLVDMQPTEAQLMLRNFWQKQFKDVQNIDSNDFKVQELPLARIKKIMKMDEDVKMISAEAPLLFAKAAQMFITELSLRAWIHTEDNKRRTLQRNDIATAITKFDQFDFLIDIVPREEVKPVSRPTLDESRSASESVQCFYTVPPQQQQQQQQQQTQQSQTVAVIGHNASQSTASTLQSNQVVVTPQGQIVQISPNSQVIGSSEGGQQIIQIAQPQQQQQQQQSQQQTSGSNIVIRDQQQAPTIVFNQQTQEPQQASINQNILQQLINSSGASPSEIHSIQINADGQVQLLKMPSTSSN